MNTMLGVLALAIFGTICDAQCTFTPLEITGGYQPDGCRDSKGVIRQFDTAWVSNCYHCTCQARIGLSCCSIAKKPVAYDQKKCMEIFQQETCTYVAVLKADHSIPCKVKKYVG